MVSVGLTPKEPIVEMAKAGTGRRKMVATGAELAALRAAYGMLREAGLQLRDLRDWSALILKIVGCGRGGCPRAQ